MHMSGKLLSTLAVALLLPCNAMSTATATETLSPHLYPSVGGRSEEEGRSLRSLDSARESSEPEEARGFERFFSSLFSNTRSSSRSPSFPKPVVLKQPKLSKEQLQQHMILEGGVIKNNKDFDVWLAKFATQPDHVQYPVFKKWHANKMNPGKLTRMLDKAGKGRNKDANKVIASYRQYVSYLSSR